MLMIGEGNRPNPTVHVPPWPIFDDQTADVVSPMPVSGVSVNANGGGGGGEYSPIHLAEALAALQRYLPSNDAETETELSGRESDVPVDAYSCDEFRMYEFKVRRCARGRTHDWTECPYAHPGEKARRRDPRKFHYSGTACPDFRKGNCKRGDSCEYAHGVFECWLHPARYRTQPCKDGTSCRRRVCFFAHTPEQLRVLPQQSPRAAYLAESPPSYDGSPLRHALDSYYCKGSPTSTLFSPPMSPPNESSPPMSPGGPGLSRSAMGVNSVKDVVASLRHLQLSKVKSAPPMCHFGSGYGSPRGMSVPASTLRPAFSSLPSTPTQPPAGYSGVGGYFDLWERGGGTVAEEPAMDRVESGRELRTRIFEKLSKENSLERVERVDSPPAGPDVGWVSELVK